MAKSSFEALKNYESSLNALEEKLRASRRGQASNQTLRYKILSVLHARDQLEQVLRDRCQAPYPLPSSMLEQIDQLDELDELLKQQSGAIAKCLDLEKWRKLYKVTDVERWWWYSVHPCDRFDWLWNAGTVLLLSVTISLLSNIASRLFTGGVDLIGAFAVGIPSALGLLAAKVVLTEFREEKPKHPSKYRKVPRPLRYLTDKLRYLQKEISFLMAVIVTVGVVLAYLKLPDFSSYYRYQGMKDHNIEKKDQWSYDFKKNESTKKATAENNYKRALALNPNDEEVHFLLGLFYEDLNNLENARQEYRYAVQSAFPPSYNNLARLHILDGKYKEAASLLIRLKKLDIPRIPILDYARFKNLGWLELEQNHLDNAEQYLKRAIEIADEDQSNSNKYRGSSHCLTAQLISKQENSDSKQDNSSKNSKDVLKSKTLSRNKKVISKNEILEWEKCQQFETGSTPEGAAWLSMAKEKTGKK